MNNNVLVSVHGYAGDADQVRDLMPFYVHHRRPVVVVSPEDAPIGESVFAGYSNAGVVRHAGKRAYVGQLSWERQRLQMKLLLEYPGAFFLMNDSDSFCAAPDLPAGLYSEDVFWSAEVSDLCHVLPADWPYPRIAFQPPYFCSRGILERLVAASERLGFSDERLPFIDHYMMRLAVLGGVPHRTHERTASCPTRNYEEGQRALEDGANHGAVMFHSVKDGSVARMLVRARQQYLSRGGS